jgi:hypothetical protein
VRAFVVGMVALGLACGDSSGPGKRASSVTGVAGDNQSAPAGTTLAAPLSFTALGSDGLPVQGVAVSWSVTPTGRATFSPQTSQTDANGRASTNVTLGPTAGAITIQATVTGVSPVVYHAIVIDPCAFFTTHTLGQTIEGALATTDCLIQSGAFGWYYDFYTFSLLPGQQSLRINMRSSTFGDTFIEFYDSAGLVVAFDDDSILTVATNSQLDIILPGADYIIGARAFEPFDVGSYSLASATRPAGFGGCRQVWVVNGVFVSDSIAAADCNDGTVPTHFDVARVWLRDGDTLRVAQRSTAVNAKLTLYQLVNGEPVNGNYPRTLVASNDDSTSGNPDAFVTYVAPVGTEGPYDIIIGTSAAGETGAYTLVVSVAGTPSPPVSRIPRRALWRDVLLQTRSKH